jgi:hypothetical protein
MNAGAPEGAGDHGNWILYDAVSGAHRIFMQSKFDGTGGQTVINSNGNFPVIINGNTGLDNGEGTGGFQVDYGGGVTPSIAISENGTTGVTTFNKSAIFSDSVNGPIQVNVPTSDTIPFFLATPGGATIKSDWFNLVTNSESSLGTGTANDLAFHVNGNDKIRVKNSTGSMWTGPSNCHAWTSAANLNTVDTSFCRNAAGVMVVGKSDSTSDSTGAIEAAGHIAGGTTFTASGCTNSALTGGATAGTFTVGQNTACTIVITMGNTATAPHGWNCSQASDETSVPTVAIRQTAHSTTSCSLLMTVATNDVVAFSAIGF